MSFHGGFLGCVAAVMLFCPQERHLRSCRSATSPPRSGRSGCCSGGSPISSTANCGAGRRIPACPGRWCFPMAGRCRAIPSQLYEAALEGILLFTILAVMIRIGALKRPGLILGSFIAIYALCPHHRRIFPRARPAARIFVGRADHGYAAVGADDHCRSDPYCGGMAPQAAEHDIEARSRQAVTEYSPLQSEIKKLIKSSGPMPVWRYMELCLTHPQHGYYVSRDPLGREGDFTTAPEVSQMFGELLGLWAASVWKAIGSPPLLRLIELGPGRGTMMADALRALRVLPPLYQSLEHPSGRDQSGAARTSSRRRCRACATSPGTTASTTCPRAPRSSSPTNISTCCRSTRW